MSQSNNADNTPQDPFEAQLSSLLAHTANDLRPAATFARDVRRRAVAGDSLHRRRPALNFSFAGLKPLGSVALITLVVVAFVWALVGHGWSGARIGGQVVTAPKCIGTNKPYDPIPAPVINPADHSIALGASATRSGVTITLDRAYADATQTVVAYHVYPDSGVSPITVNSPDLIDAAGARYPWLDGSGTMEPDNHIENLIVFAPLPQTALGAPQRLTFSATTVESPPPEGQDTGHTLSGPWIIPFTITPTAGTAIPLTLPAQTHNGVTIQPVEVDVAPEGGGLDGQNGGARVRYRFSGLPSDMRLADVMQYPTSFVSLGSAQSGAPGGPGCHDLLTLKLASGQELIPGFMLANGQVRYTLLHPPKGSAEPTVGASGSVEIQALFFGPIPSGTATMTFNSALVSSMRDGTVDNQSVDAHVVQGPWVFDIPLHP